MNEQLNQENSQKQAIVETCQKLHEKGYLAAADGNVSIRLDDRILITPSGVAKTSIGSDDMAELNVEGTVTAGRPSSERLMHLTVYRHCPAARAVVHAHPPHAIAWSIARPDLQWLPAGALSELILAVGAVPVVPYARPTTPQLGDNLIPYLPAHRALIMSRHGVICWGESLEEAYHGVERLEHAAQVLALAQQMGGVSQLPDDEIDALRQMRRQLGEKIL